MHEIDRGVLDSRLYWRAIGDNGDAVVRGENGDLQRERRGDDGECEE
jgi:hypothetical protein